MASSDVDIKSFLGLRKITVVYVLVLLLVLTWGSTLFQIYQIQHLAQKDASATRALCVFREDFVERRNDTLAFLSLTPEQRVKKYGALGHIPESVLNSQLINENNTISSLKPLRCH